MIYRKYYFTAHESTALDRPDLFIDNSNRVSRLPAHINSFAGIFFVSTVSALSHSPNSCTGISACRSTVDVLNPLFFFHVRIQWATIRSRNIFYWINLLKYFFFIPMKITFFSPTKVFFFLKRNIVYLIIIEHLHSVVPFNKYNKYNDN